MGALLQPDDENPIGMIVTESDVRHLLRHLRQPHLLAKSRLATDLQNAFGTSTPRGAVTVAVQNAFSADEQSAEKLLLRDIIVQNDIENFVERTSAARGHAISLRSFYRKRTQAVRLLVQYLNAILARDNRVAHLSRRCHVVPDTVDEVTGNDVFCAAATAASYAGKRAESERLLCEAQRRRDGRLSRGDLNVAFEISRTRFFCYRVFGDALAMSESLDTVRAYRPLLTAPQLLELSVMEGELHLYRAEFSVVATILDDAVGEMENLNSDRLRAMILFLRAQLDFTIGDLQGAQVWARAVRRVASQSPELRVRSTALLSRIAGLKGSPWRRFHGKTSGVWATLFLQSIQARHLFLTGRYDEAHHLASRVYLESYELGLVTVSCRSAATLAACYRGVDPGKCAQYAIASLRLLAASSSNTYLARDLFQFGGRLRGESAIAWLDENAYGDLAVIYLALNPESAFAGADDRHNRVARLLRGIMRRVAGLNDPEPSEDSAAMISHSMHGALSNEITHLTDFGEFLKALVPLEGQAVFASSFRSSALAAVRTIMRSRSYSTMRSLSIFA